MTSMADRSAVIIRSAVTTWPTASPPPTYTPLFQSSPDPDAENRTTPFVSSSYVQVQVADPPGGSAAAPPDGPAQNVTYPAPESIHRSTAIPFTFADPLFVTVRCTSNGVGPFTLVGLGR